MPIDSSKIEFKEKFIERYKQLTDFDKFKEYSLKFLRRSIRVNTIKISVKDLKKRLEKNWLLTQIPWCNEGFFIKSENRKDIGNLIEHTLGYIYIQEAASMIPAIVLNPRSSDIVLDMCASPGSKTTHLASIMENKGLIIANDYKYERMKPLKINLERCGITNTVTTLMLGQYIKELEFDKILVDAPCSGTGTIRKSLKTLQIWNPNIIRRLSITQKNLIINGFSLLKEKGTLVYSTCSLEPEENEEVIDHLLKKFPEAKIEQINLKIKSSKPILKFKDKVYSKEVKNCLRIWPQDNDTEGFFVAKIKKP